MALTDTDYLHQLQALLPTGPAWSKDDAAPLTGLLAALSVELARVDGQAWRIVEEADPRTTAELFLDWERVAGLPDACAALDTVQLPAGLHAIDVNDLTLFSRASTATYVDGGLVKTAGAGTPRWESGQLLVEDSATNLLTYSEQFDNAAWVPAGGAAVASNATTAPDGTTTADILTLSQTKHKYQAFSVAAGTYCYSVFVKSAGSSQYYHQINCNGTGATVAAINVNFGTGSVSTRFGVPVSSGIQSVGNGWFRVWIVGVHVSGSISNYLCSAIVTDDTVYAWGAQLEAGSFPTSYIPTTSAADSRADEEATIFRPMSIDSRRNALVGRLTSSGGSTPEYFIGLAAAIGYAITITEFSAHTVNDDVNAEVCDESWNFAWQVNAALNTASEFNVDMTVDDPLAAWGNALLECVLSRLKPAHTTVLFSYA